MEAPDSHHLLHDAVEWMRDIMAACLVPLLAWLGWLFRRYLQDRDTLKTLDGERTEYQKRFGGNLCEHTQDIEDALEELDKGQCRCDRIHDGMGEDDNGRTMLEGVRKEIEIEIDEVRQELHAYKFDDMKFKQRIAVDFAWIRERLST